MSGTSLAGEVERAREGDPTAWGEVYRQLAPAVFRLCRQVLSTREDAEDASAEIFLKVQVRLEQYDLARPFRPWHYRFAANHCWDELRKRRSRKEIDGSDLESWAVESAEPGPDEQVLARETHQQVRAALTHLDDRGRTRALRGRARVFRGSPVGTRRL